MLRSRMSEWGMDREIDFNTTDVVVAEEGSGKRKKTRAYDFILPFNVNGWCQQLFVQCQFYAGDSGSVSHKNVDQTSTSRLKSRRGNMKRQYSLNMWTAQDIFRRLTVT